MTTLEAEGFPAEQVRDRARRGAAAAFPSWRDYGNQLFGAMPYHRAGAGADPIDELRLVPPVFVPQRLDTLIDLAREPLYGDVVLDTEIGGFNSMLPIYVSAFGSTQVASTDIGLAASRQAGHLGIPMVIGENVVPINGYGRAGTEAQRSLLARLRAYVDHSIEGVGGVVVQQSTEDADAEVWNLVYSDPSAQVLLESGRLAFELKVGQGAKPGLGGMTVLDRESAAKVAEQFALDPVFGEESGRVLRCSSPGTFTEEILRQQIRLMRNNFPRAQIWVKLPPARDIGAATAVAWDAEADAVTVDGAEGGTGYAPNSFLDQVGLPLGVCLRRIGRYGGPAGCLLVSGRIWEGARAVKCLALGARAVGLGRAALLAVAEDPESGLVRLADCMAIEMRMLISALGKYSPAALGYEDVWAADENGWVSPTRSSVNV